MKYHALSLSISSALALPALTLTTPQAYAQDTATADERITVIGSRLSVRTATDGAAPVDIITADDLTSSGITETAKALQYAVPSFNFPSSSITDGSDAVRPASLRGLSPDHTLVLINGKRRHSSALVHLNGTTGRGSSNADLNAIPIAAIERIEVLRDGAAALYGSDAIAGVINIVLKDNAEGGNLKLNGGQTYEGDGEQYKAEASVGINLNDEGSLTLAAEYHHKNKTNRAGPDLRQQYPLVDGEPDPREETFNRNSWHVGDAEFENASLFFNADYALGEGEFYAFGGISERETESGAFYRRALQDNNLPEVYPDGYLPQLMPETSDQSVTAGYQWSLGYWDFDLSAGYGKSEFQYLVGNTINASLGAQSPTSFDAGTLENTETNVTFDVSRFVPFYNNSDLSIAFGASFRENTYEITAGQEESYITGDYQGLPNPEVAKPGGSQGFTGFRPESEVDESRDNVGVYLELENMLTADFQWGAAIRYEDYSDFGDNVSWKVSSRYDITDELALRAAVNTGFRAPSVQQIYFTNVSTLFANIDGELIPEQSGTFNNISDVAQALDIGALQPEESQSYSFGVVWNGYEGFTLTVDAFQIEIEDRIILSGQLRPSDSPAVAEALADTGAENARFFVNAVDSTTQGVDVVASQDFDLGSYGFLNAQFAYGYNETEIDDVVLPSVLGGLEQQLFDNIERTRMTESVPQHSGSFRLNHDIGKWTTNIAFSYFGDYTLEGNPIDGERNRTNFGGKWVVDLTAGYQFNDNLALRAGVQNLLDEYPDEQRPENNNGGIFKYPNTNAPFGFNGGYYFTELTYSF